MDARGGQIINAYRVALILCRAVAMALWWQAGIGVLATAALFVVAQLNIATFKGVPALATSGQSLLNAVMLAIGAGFLQIFAASLANSMTGGGAFEGDSIAPKRALDAPEKALGNAGAGLFLLFSGAVRAGPLLFALVYTLLFDRNRAGAGASLIFYMMLSNVLPAALECLVGFVLAFGAGLRRLVKAQS